jgi:hypothetical protein
MFLKHVAIHISATRQKCFVLLHNVNSDIQAEQRASVVADNHLGKKAIECKRVITLVADLMVFTKLGKRASWKFFGCSRSVMLVFYHVVF